MADLILPAHLEKYRSFIAFVNSRRQTNYFRGYPGLFRALIIACKTGYINSPDIGYILNYNGSEGHGLQYKNQIYFYLDNDFSVVEAVGSWPTSADESVLTGLANKISNGIIDYLVILDYTKGIKIEQDVPIEIIFSNTKITINMIHLLLCSSTFVDLVLDQPYIPPTLHINIDCSEKTAQLIGEIISHNGQKLWSICSLVMNSPDEYQKLIQILDFLGIQFKYDSQ